VIAKGGEVFVFDMGKPMKIIDLARNMIRLAGYRPDIDIKITFIGERPGEKLYEEVFHANEELQNTHHEKIMISKKNGYDSALSNTIIEKLTSLKGQYQPELYRELIKELMPEYNYFNGNDKLSTFNSINIAKDHKIQSCK